MKDIALQVLTFAGLFPTLIGLFVLFHLFRPQKAPADSSNRINKIRLFWFALTRENLFTGVFPWLKNDELENVPGLEEIDNGPIEIWLNGLKFKLSTNGPDRKYVTEIEAPGRAVGGGFLIDLFNRSMIHENPLMEDGPRVTYMRAVTYSKMMKTRTENKNSWGVLINPKTLELEWYVSSSNLQ